MLIIKHFFFLWSSNSFKFPFCIHNSRDSKIDEYVYGSNRDHNPALYTIFKNVISKKLSSKNKN